MLAKREENKNMYALAEKVRTARFKSEGRIDRI